MNAPERDTSTLEKESSAQLESARHSCNGVFVPMLLIAAAILLWVAFQSLQLVRERSNLDAGRLSQETLVQNSQKLRTALDVLATETARLAQTGNKSAQVIVQELNKRGVTIKSNETSSR